MGSESAIYVKNAPGSGDRLLVICICRSRVSGTSGLVIITGMWFRCGELMACAAFGLRILSMVNPVLPMRLFEIYDFSIHTSNRNKLLDMAIQIRALQAYTVKGCRLL